MRSYVVVLCSPRAFPRLLRLLARHGLRVEAVIVQVEVPEEKRHVMGGVAQIPGVSTVLRGSVMVPR